MIYLALAELAIIAYLVVLLHRSRNHEVEAILQVMSSNDVERAELLTRIQRPDLVPQRTPPGRASAPPADIEQYAQVGTLTAVPPRAES